MIGGEAYNPAAGDPANVAKQHAEDILVQAVGATPISVDKMTVIPIILEALRGGLPEPEIIARLQNTLGVNNYNQNRSRAFDRTLPPASQPLQIADPNVLTPQRASNGGTGATGGTAPSTHDILQGLADQKYAEWQSEKDATKRADAQAELLGIVKQLDASKLAEQGKVTLGDGTVITSRMLNDPDPAVAAQWQQLYADRQNAIENDNVGLINKYAQQSYSNQRQQVADNNATILASYNAEMDSIRTRLARGTLDEKTAADAVTRAIQGLQESRGRASLEETTAKDFAPYGTVGGKTDFSASDLGASTEILARNAGLSPSDSVIKFPGVINFNPQRAMAQTDAAFGVDGPLPTMPQVAVSDADIPRGVGLSSPGAIALPQFAPPVPRRIILPQGQLSGAIDNGDLNVPVR